MNHAMRLEKGRSRQYTDVHEGRKRIPTEGGKMSLGDYKKGALRDMCDAPWSRRVWRRKRPARR